MKTKNYIELNNMTEQSQSEKEHYAEVLREEQQDYCREIDPAKLKEAIRLGSIEWKGVKDATKWVRERRD